MQSFKEKMSSQGNNLECCDVCAGKEESATLPDISASFGSANIIATQPMFSRSVDEEDKTLLREVLLEHVCSNVTTSVFGIGNLVNAIDKETVEQIVLNCHCIFNTEYLMDNFPVLSFSLAQKILSIINEVFGDLQEVAETSNIVLEDWDCDPLMVNVSGWCRQHDEDESSDTDATE